MSSQRTTPKRRGYSKSPMTLTQYLPIIKPGELPRDPCRSHSHLVYQEPVNKPYLLQGDDALIQEDSSDENLYEDEADDEISSITDVSEEEMNASSQDEGSDIQVGNNDLRGEGHERKEATHLNKDAQPEDKQLQIRSSAITTNGLSGAHEHPPNDTKRQAANFEHKSTAPEEAVAALEDSPVDAQNAPRVDGIERMTTRSIARQQVSPPAIYLIVFWSEPSS
ncbi:MAG: hypothetical protein Q9227_002917 [Pyrenula ochraceoflavens]